MRKKAEKRLVTRLCKIECEKRSKYIQMRKQRIRAKYLITALMLMFSLFSPFCAQNTRAEACPKLRIVFARGSGAPMENDKNYEDFVGWIQPKLAMSNFEETDYEFINLDYPAIGMNVENIWAVVGAFMGAGDTYEFGRSVDTGVKNLVKMVNGTCPSTRYILGGYSQGAMVISKASRFIYATVRTSFV